MSKRAEEATKEIYKDGIQLVGRRDRNNNIVIHPETMVGVLRNAAQKGYEQAEKDLGWHPSTEHPPVDKEVIALTDELNTAPVYKIAFGHIVNKEVAVDHDGWNIEGVRYWMPMPKIPEK